jgi:hypothetical protein
LVVLDIPDPSNPTEVGHYDTYEDDRDDGRLRLCFVILSHHYNYIDILEYPHIFSMELGVFIHLTQAAKYSYLI